MVVTSRLPKWLKARKGNIRWVIGGHGQVRGVENLDAFIRNL